MDRKNSIFGIAVIVILIIAGLCLMIHFNNKKINKLELEKELLSNNIESLKKKSYNDSLDFVLNSNSAETKYVIKYKTNEIRKDSLIFIDMDTVDKERVFSKHTKNY